MSARVVNRASKPFSLTLTIAALQNISQAVRDCNRAAYVEARARAFELGCSAELVDDAYTHTVGTMGVWVPMFDLHGEHRL